MNQSQQRPRISKEDITELVIEDLKARRELGKAKYGTTLQPFNGRNSLLDAYQEALDLVQYLRQRLEEDKNREDNSREGSEIVEGLHRTNVYIYRQILLEHGPMHLMDLTKEALRRGVLLSTQGRKMQLKVRDSLSRSKKFNNLGDNRWEAV